MRICSCRGRLPCECLRRSASIGDGSTAEGPGCPRSALQSKLFAHGQGNTWGSVCLLWSRGWRARRALEGSRNYTSFTPRDSTCLGLPFWHVGFRDHPALQCILAVRCPALQDIPLRSMLFLSKDLAFST